MTDKHEEQEENKIVSTRITNADNWKMKHDMSKKKVEAERDKWEDKFYEIDKKLVDAEEENARLREELTEWEKGDLRKRKIVSPTQQEEEMERQKQQQLQRFLSRIGGRTRKI